MKQTVVLVFLAVVVVGLPASAGKDCHVCTKPVQDCLNAMVVKLRSTGFIGVELDKCKNTGILTVTKVIEDSPAAQAGILVGDQLLALNGIGFDKENHEKLAKVKVPGKEVRCTIGRNGSNREFTLTLAPMPADIMAKYIGEHMMMHATEGGNSVAQK